MANSRVKEILNNAEIHFVLYKGFKQSDNSPVHAFVVMNKTNMNKLSNETGAVSVGNYGEIFYSNYGHEISENIYIAAVNGFKKRYLK